MAEFAQEIVAARTHRLQPERRLVVRPPAPAPTRQRACTVRQEPVDSRERRRRLADGLRLLAYDLADGGDARCDSAPPAIRRSMASSSIAAQSSSPSRHRRGRIGATINSRSPSLKTVRLAARLPLSTLDTYRGESGSMVCVSYQLKKCPRYRSIRSRVASVCSVR